MHLVRRLYDWVLSWAESPYGALALSVLAFAESSFFPVPPDVLLIALVLGKRSKAFLYALICSISSVGGGMFGYLIGKFLWVSLADFFFKYVPGFTPQVFQAIQGNYQNYGFLYVCIAGFSPIPYKVFTIGAGVFEMNFFHFVIASTLSRSARFFLVASLLYKFGPPIKKFIDKYFNVLTLVFIALLVLGFLVVKIL